MDPARAAWAQGVLNAVVKAQIHLVENRAAMAEMLSKDGKGYLPFPKEVVERAMMLYDIPYPGNAEAIKHKDWGNDRINFQGWPYPSATELVVNDMKKTVITGDAAFLDKLTPETVAERPGQLHLHQEGAGSQPEVEERPQRAEDGRPVHAHRNRRESRAGKPWPPTRNS